MLRIKSMDRHPAFQALSPVGRRRLQGAHSTRVGATADTETSSRDKHTPSTLEDVSTAETDATERTPGQTRAHGSLTTPTSIDVEAVRNRVKEWGVLASSSLQQRVDDFSKNATTTFSHLGSYLNRATGYEEIETLKRQVVTQEAQIKATRRAAREAKTAYEDAVLQRSVSQRQVNDLLQRKSSWTETDVSNFTTLVRSDHSFEQEESRAKARVTETEDAAEREFSELMKVILARYHEEQVWSDKIRSASTYGSLAVLGVNLVVFIMAIIVVEPWKRKRLAQTFEKKVEEMGAETKALISANAAQLEELLAGHGKVLTQLVTRIPSEAPQASPITPIILEEARVEGTAGALPLPSSWWSRAYFIHPYLGVIGSRELMLVAGSAAVGGAITLLTHSLFVR